MSDARQNPYQPPQLDPPQAPPKTGDKCGLSPAKRGFWLGFKITAWVFSVITAAMIVFLVYDSLTGKPAPYLVPTIIAILFLNFSVGLTLSLAIGAGAAWWMTLLSTPLRRKK